MGEDDESVAGLFAAYDSGVETAGCDLTLEVLIDAYKKWQKLRTHYCCEASRYEQQFDWGTATIARCECGNVWVIGYRCA